MKMQEKLVSCYHVAKLLWHGIGDAQMRMRKGQGLTAASQLKYVRRFEEIWREV